MLLEKLETKKEFLEENFKAAPKSNQQSGEGDYEDAEEEFGSSKNKDQNARFAKSTRPRESRVLFDAIYLNRYLTSTYIITTTNNLNFIGARATYRKNLSETEGDDFFMAVHVMKHQGVTKGEYQIPMLRSFHTGVVNSFKYLPFDTVLTAQYENQFFINLAEENGGLKVANNNFFWAMAGVERVLKLKKLRIAAGFNYGKVIYSTSDFKKQPLNLDGNRVQTLVDFIYLKWRFGMSVANESFYSTTDSKLTFEQKSFLLNVSRAL